MLNIKLELFFTFDVCPVTQKIHSFACSHADLPLDPHVDLPLDPHAYALAGVNHFLE